MSTDVATYTVMRDAKAQGRIAFTQVRNDRGFPIRERWTVVACAAGVPAPTDLYLTRSTAEAALLEANRTHPRTQVGTDGLTGLQRDVLDFETAYPAARLHGHGANAIRTLFGFSRVRYVQLLVHLVRQPTAIAYAPQTCARVTRELDKKRATGGRGLGRTA